MGGSQGNDENSNSQRYCFRQGARSEKRARYTKYLSIFEAEAQRSIEPYVKESIHRDIASGKAREVRKAQGTQST